MNKRRILGASVKRIVLLFITKVMVLALIVTLGVMPVRAQATTFTTSFSQPTDLIVFVPCAVAGVGEYVQLSGSLHILFVTTIDNQAGFHSDFLVQPQGISGTGLTTGAKYQATGETQGTFNGKVGYESTFVNNFKIIGQGPGNDFLVHETFHITVNPDGTLTAYAYNFSAKCKSQ